MGDIPYLHIDVSALRQGEVVERSGWSVVLEGNRLSLYRNREGDAGRYVCITVPTLVVEDSTDPPSLVSLNALPEDI